MCSILSMTNHEWGGKIGGDSSPYLGLGQRPGENFLVLNFLRVVCAHCLVHGFAHGIGVRWFSAPSIFVDPVKGTMVMF